MAKRAINDTELKAILVTELALSQDHNRSELTTKRSTALEYYQGKMPDVPAEKGRSSVVSRDVADTIGWMLPGIIRVFTASDRMAIAEPVGKEDDAMAEQATDAINYVFWKDNDGYKLLHSATFDSLLMANGIIKTYWDDTPEHAVSFHTGLSDDAFADLVSADDVEVLQHTERTEKVEAEEAEQPQQPDAAAMMAPEPQPVEMTVHDVKIKRLKSKGRTRVECIAPEDYLIDADAKTCAAARFQAHHSRETRSSLVEMGFPLDIVNTIPKASKSETPAEVARQEPFTGDNTGDTSMEEVDYYECFMRIDADGDGVAETCRICFAGNKSNGEMLDWEVWEDETPFDDIPCNPMPHRWDAESIADETMDIQRVKSVALRGGLDGMYAANNPQRQAEEGSILNPDELNTPTFGGTVWRKKGSLPVEALEVPFTAGHAFDILNYMDQVKQQRTGVARQTMALDAEALTNQSATANNNEKDASYSQIELVARNMAELGWKPVFKKILRLEARHQDRARTIRMRGKWVDIDPRDWNADMDVTIDVGLGTGSRDRDAMMLQGVLGDQVLLADRLSAGGFGEEAIQLLPFIHNTLVKKAESAGLKNPEQFYPEITDDMVQQAVQKLQAMKAQGDPKVAADQAKAQADAQLAAQKQQTDAQLQQQKTEYDWQMSQQKLNADQAKADQDFQLRREQLAAEMQLKREQLNAELGLKREQMIAELELQRELGHANAAAKASANVSSSVHPGGEPG